MFCDILRAPCMGALLTPPGIITITGGGGKTSLMYALLASLKAKGIKAVGATTTKIYINDRHEKEIIFAKSAFECIQAVAQANAIDKPAVICSGIDPLNGDKAVGIKPEWLDKISRDMPDCLFIVEGDGAAGKPLKGYLPHEPVIPQTTKLVIPVVGLDALGQLIDESVVHRAVRFSELAGVRPGEVITGAMVAKVIGHPDGYLHNVPLHAHIIPFLNKAETLGRLRSALTICREFTSLQRSVLDAVLIGSIEKGAYSIRILKH